MDAWIRMIRLEDATGALEDMYRRALTPSGTVDNVMRAHSLRPHTMEGHLALYRSVLHHSDNTLPLWFLECVAVCTSLANKCTYSFTHHWANARRLLKNEAKADGILEALQTGVLEKAFSRKEQALLKYARKLTLAPGDMVKSDVDECRAMGADDGEILEVNQVCAYFNYSNRLLNGLGVPLGDDIVGYYKAE
ncbi:MAG: carboxymuconolactone decarboxylase family protein [Dongiaceae bacterium]